MQEEENPVEIKENEYDDDDGSEDN